MGVAKGWLPKGAGRWVPRVGSARSVLCCVLAMGVRVACWLFPARVVLGCLRVRIEQAVLALYQVRVGPSRSVPCWLSYVLAVRAVPGACLLHFSVHFVSKRFL